VAKTKSKRKKKAMLVIPLPDMGLSKAAMARLRNKFRNDVIEALGGARRLGDHDIIINMIVAEPEPWLEISEGQ